MYNPCGINVSLLDAKIVDSGLKIGFIANKLGYTRQGFNKKCRGITPFTARDMFILCDLLRISDEDTKLKIFYPEGTP